MVRNYGKWANAHPKEADKLGRVVGVPAVMMMAAPTTGAYAIAALRSPQLYLVFSLATRPPTLDVVEGFKAAQERQRAAQLVEAEMAELKTIEKRIEEILEAGNKKDVPPPPPSPPPDVPEPSPSKLPSAAPVVQPENNSND